MENTNIFHYIIYAQATGDQKPLFEYIEKKADATIRKTMDFLQKDGNSAGDNILFMLAFLDAFSDVTKAGMTPGELEIIQAIKNTINISVVKTSIPIPPGYEQ